MVNTTDLDVGGDLSAAILAGMAEGVVYADRDGIIRQWNASATAIFGYTEADATGQNLDIIIPERFRDAHWRGFHAAVERGATAAGRQARLTRATHKEPGRDLYVEMSFAIVTDSHDAVRGAVAVARDVTERHLAQRAERR